MTTTAYIPAPEGTPADAPRVFAVIAAVMSDAMPVGKNQQNSQQNYKFRGIDDVMSAMAGPMRRHGLFILPSIAEHTQTRDGKMTRTVITMRYRIYGPAGDCLVADVPGEAFDFADKSTNKAQSAALKYLLFTLFMLPVDGRSIDDGDRHHPEPTEEQRAEYAEMRQRRQERRQGHGGQQPRRAPAAEVQRPATPKEPTPADAQSTAWTGTVVVDPESLRPHPEAQEIARAAAKASSRDDVKSLWERARAEDLLNAGIQGPDTDEPCMLGEYLTRRGHLLAADREQAVVDLYAAAHTAQVPDVDAEFRQSYGVPIERAAVGSLREMTALLTGAA